MQRRAFINFVIVYIFVLASIIVSISASVLLDYIKKKEIQSYQIEANSFIVSEQNNVINYCLGTPLYNYTYYEDFNYGQKIKFVLSCKTQIDVSTGQPYISYNLKGCRERDYIKTNTYPICLNYSGKIYLAVN